MRGKRRRARWLWPVAQGRADVRVGERNAWSGNKRGLDGVPMVGDQRMGSRDKQRPSCLLASKFSTMCAMMLVAVMALVASPTATATPVPADTPEHVCPAHTTPAGLHQTSSSELYCLCIRNQNTYCTGHLCRIGRTRGSAEDDFVIGFPSACRSCDCKHLTAKQRDIVPLTTWDDKQVYYHLHISKTGGTTLEHIVQRLARHPSAPTAMSVCDTEKHPFSHPPLFANPAELEKSGCNVITAEGRMRFIEEQLPYVKPHLMILLRHPVLRTLSQFQHDLIQEKTLRDKEWRTPYTQGFSDLKLLYLNSPGVVHKRYRDWQLDLLSHPNLTYPDALNNMTFIGITDFYKTSMCLFYFTFQLPSLLHGCQERPLTIYNKACTGDDCERFHNAKERHVRDEDNHKRLQQTLASIDPETRALIEKNTRKDQELYNAALDIFWRRVAVMEEVVGERFHDLPDEYRQRLARVSTEVVFDPPP